MKTLCCLLTLLGTLVLARAADPFEDAFHAALIAEESKRDLNAAIRGYQEVVARLDAQRTLAATAVFRLGECYRKLGRTNEAAMQYQRLLRDFASEEALARLSRENLLALGLGPDAGIQGGGTNAVGALPVPAIDDEQREILRLRTLFDRSPDLLEAVGSDKMTPLQTAASRGQLTVVKALIEWGVDVNRVEEGQSALHHAARGGHKAVIDALLDAKADPNVATSLGDTPLSISIRRGFQAVIETLLARGASPKLEVENASLFAAVETGRTNLIERLARAGVNVNFVRPAGSPVGAQSGYYTPLASAIRANQRESSRTLVRFGATPIAAPGEKHPLWRLLTDLGPRAGPDWIAELLKAAPPGGYPASLLEGLLTLAAGNPALDKHIPPLLDAGALVSRTPGIPNALLRAAENGSARGLEFLLTVRPDLNVGNAGGVTALHFVALSGKTNQVAALLKAGADPNRLDGSNLTPLDYARRALAEMEQRARSNPSSSSPREVASQGAEVPTRESYLTVEALLRAAGAREDVARRRSILIRNGDFSTPTFERHGDSPPPRLADVLGRIYQAGAGNGSRWDWPNLEALRILRLRDDGASEYGIPVAANWMKEEDCGWNFALEWGDCVEIPEVDRVIRTVWQGLPQKEAEVIQRCTARQVTLRVKGESLVLNLSSHGAIRVAPPTSQLRPVVPSSPGSAAVALPSAPRPVSPRDSEKVLTSCLLKAVLEGSNRLRASSDLTRVKVIRASASKEWTLDVLGSTEAANFWLLDGDVIEVSEKAL